MSAEFPEPHALRSMVVACPECGAACTGTYKFWYRGQHFSDGLELDQPTLDEALSGLVERTAQGYSTLPDFVRAYNETRDYFWTNGPAPLNPDDFEATLDLLEANQGFSRQPAQISNVLRELRRLLAGARLDDAELIFLDD